MKNSFFSGHGPSPFPRPIFRWAGVTTTL